MGGYVKTITYDDSLYCLVPIEPSDEMVDCVDRAWNSLPFFTRSWSDIYKAMLAARPTNVQPAQDPDAIRAAGQCCCDDS